MTEFYLVRHAQPNYQNRSETDRELTPKGASDCRYVTQYLEDHGVTTMYSSPYRRAVDTVRGYAEKHSLPITFDSDLRERGIDDSWVTDFKDFMRRQWADFSYKLPGGESLSEVQTRVVTAIRRIAKAHPGESIAAGGHGTALCTVINYYKPDFDYAAALTVLPLMPVVLHLTFDGGELAALAVDDLGVGTTPVPEQL